MTLDDWIYHTLLKTLNLLHGWPSCQQLVIIELFFCFCIRYKKILYKLHAVAHQTMLVKCDSSCGSFLFKKKMKIQANIWFWSFKLRFEHSVGKIWIHEICTKVSLLLFLCRCKSNATYIWWIKGWQVPYAVANWTAINFTHFFIEISCSQSHIYELLIVVWIHLFCIAQNASNLHIEMLLLRVCASTLWLCMRACVRTFVYNILSLFLSNELNTMFILCSLHHHHQLETFFDHL